MGNSVKSYINDPQVISRMIGNVANGTNKEGGLIVRGGRPILSIKPLRGEVQGQFLSTATATHCMRKLLDLAEFPDDYAEISIDLPATITYRKEPVAILDYYKGE